MRKIVSFFIGLLLLAITFATVVLVALIYRSNNQLSVKSYIFQMGNYAATQRVGPLQKLEDMSAIELRNKLIKKYVSEYFLVIPGEQNVNERSVLERLSDTYAYKQWQSGEAKTIADMAAKKMFRRVYVSDADIAAMDMPDGYDYYDADSAEPILYSVHYRTETWPESNAMWIEPVYETGDIYLEIKFTPGIRETVNGKKFNIKKYLESGNNPVGLFMFKVISIGDGEN